MWLYLGIMVGLCAFALVRVHMMAGYCTPRHALVLAWILTLAGGAGLAHLAALAGRIVARLKRIAWAGPRIEAAFVALALALLIGFSVPALTAPIDSGFAGYREAGEWLAARAAPEERA